MVLASEFWPVRLPIGTTLPRLSSRYPTDPTYKPKPLTVPKPTLSTTVAAPVVSTPGVPSITDPGVAYSAAPIVVPDPLAGQAYSTVYYSGPSFWSQYSSYFYWAVILYLAYRYRHQLMHLLRAAK